MGSSTSGAPPWLFSFVDLAFLLLIAMTQLGDRSAGEMPDFGQLAIPRISTEASEDLPAGGEQLWQLRVHPSEANAGPFELTRTESLTPETDPIRLDMDALREQLVALRGTDEKKPLLAPHEDSRSHDLLQAVALIEEHWPEGRRATVELPF